MILVRNVFQLKFGVAKEAKAKVKEGMALAAKAGMKDSRACLDLTGRFYTLVLEITYDDLAAFEAAHVKLSEDETWRQWYASFSELIESGHREIYTVVE